MRTIGQLLICLLLLVPSVQAAFGPCDVEAMGSNRAASLVRAVEHHVITQSDRLSVYLQVPAVQLRAVAELPVLREVARALRLREVEQVLTARVPSGVPRACQRRG